MCRSIKTLRPPMTPEVAMKIALTEGQYPSGTRRPPRVERSVDRQRSPTTLNPESLPTDALDDSCLRLDRDHDVLRSKDVRSAGPIPVVQRFPKLEAAFPIQIPDEGFRVGDRRFRIFDVEGSCTLHLMLELEMSHSLHAED